MLKPRQPRGKCDRSEGFIIVIGLSFQSEEIGQQARDELRMQRVSRLVLPTLRQAAGSDQRTDLRSVEASEFVGSANGPFMTPLSCSTMAFVPAAPNSDPTCAPSEVLTKRTCAGASIRLRIRLTRI